MLNTACRCRLELGNSPPDAASNAGNKTRANGLARLPDVRAASPRTISRPGIQKARDSDGQPILW